VSGRDSSVVVSILERDPEACRHALERVPSTAGSVEIRADRLPHDAVPGLVRLAAVPVIVTLRRVEHGGAWDGPEEARARVYRAALDAGAAWVDVEWGMPAAVGIDPARIVLSHHGAPCDLGELAEVLDGMASTAAARLKIVPAGAPAGAAVGTVRELLQMPAGRGRLCAFALGRAAAVTRVLAPSWGSWGTYAAPARGSETASGQLTAEDLVEVFDVDRIGPATRKVALVGADLSRSPSPAMHNAALREAGVDGRYLAIEIGTVEEVEGLREILALEGVGVTMPFKEAAARTCDELDWWARRSGVVNTVRFGPGGRRSGFNTDAAALDTLLSDGAGVAGREAVVVGSGGTARTFAAVLARAGARVVMASRDPRAAARAAAELGVGAITLELAACSRAPIWAFAIPMPAGLRERLPPRDATVEILVDAAYGTEPGGALIDAAARGACRIDGLDLLAEQGVRQLDILMGVRADRKSAGIAARRRLRDLDGFRVPD